MKLIEKFFKFIYEIETLGILLLTIFVLFMTWLLLVVFEAAKGMF